MSQKRIIFMILLLMLAGTTWAATDLIVRNMAWNDTIGRHIGCQAFFQGVSPYSDQVNQAIAAKNPDPLLEQRFYNPAHICLILFPFWLLPYELSLRLWIALLLIIFVAVPPLLLLQVFRWRLKPWQLLIVVVVLLLGFRYSMMTIVLGQYTGFVMLCIAGSLVSLALQRPIFAAIFLASLTIRPDGALIAAGIGLLAAYKREWRVIVVTLVLGLVFFIGTLPFIGNWLPAFLDDVRYYSITYNNVRWLPDFFPAPFSWLLVVVALITAGIILFRLRTTPDDKAFYFTGGSVFVLLSLLLLPQTNPYTLVFAIPVLCWLLYCWRYFWGTWGLFVLIVGILPWLIFQGGREWAHIDQLMYPLVAGCVLFFTKHR